MPTALELEKQGWQPYLKAVKKLPPKPESKEIKEERSRLLEQVYGVASILKSQFGAERVFLFGSLVHQAWFDDYSDIDLAVTGLSWDEYTKAWDMLRGYFPNRKVDLVQIEDISDHFAQTILDNGIEL